MYDLVWLCYAEANNEQDQEQRLASFLRLFYRKEKKRKKKQKKALPILAEYKAVN